MKNKVAVVVISVLFMAGLVLFFTAQRAPDVNAQSVSAASNQVNSYSASDVGVSALRISQSIQADSNQMTAGGARVVLLPVANSNVQLNNIWAIERETAHQSIGWRDAGAGSRNQ